MSIGYLPLAPVWQNFQLFTTGQETRRLLRVYPVLDDFVQYMDNTYTGANATFPPAVWNVHGRASDNRSNNWVEGNLNVVIIISEKLSF